MALCFNGQNIPNKVRTYKNNLKSIANIAGSNPAGGIDFVLMSVVCWQVHISAMGLSKFQKRYTVFLFML